MWKIDVFRRSRQKAACLFCLVALLLCACSPAGGAKKGGKTGTRSVVSNSTAETESASEQAGTVSSQDALQLPEIETQTDGRDPSGSSGSVSSVNGKTTGSSASVQSGSSGTVGASAGKATSSQNKGSNAQGASSGKSTGSQNSGSSSSSAQNGEDPAYHPELDGEYVED